MLQIIIKGGWVMVPLIICSLVSLTIIVERLWFLKKIAATDYAEQIVSLVKKGQVEEAARLSNVDAAPLLRVLHAGIEHISNPVKAMEAAAIAEITILKRGLPVLDTIITLSPLLGLLGTIIGMISSFQVMAVGSIGQPHVITGGVAEALIATAAGILVAVSSLIPYNYFLTRVEKETEVIEYYATRLEVVLGTRPHRSDMHEDSKKYA
ncbi:MotA/TolQ/ExbB proton channel family protein [Propionispora vibrioides]|uniref:Outer membrane transport energization protein ExbB n=1 Tax=Propionispora vibrioides TaxID=112903 RepID=A0A1H8T3L3_9FIRM|nr:MotA/TolQ/ExbB proton channel family protein [Propionispora vibrioides]SEO85502.1 outer membrane transport energization protein ExbB [Propionispora vibrioides]